MSVIVINPYRYAVAASGIADDFNRADGGLGSNWTVVQGTFAVASNKCSITTSGRNQAYWNAATPADNQYAEAVVTAPVLPGSQVGVICRHNGGNAQANSSFYVLRWEKDSGNLSITKIINGGITNLTSAAVSQATLDGKTVRLECSGTTLTGYLNGVSTLSTTDAALTTGRVGLWGHSGGGTTTVDDFAAGDL